MIAPIRLSYSFPNKHAFWRRRLNCLFPSLAKIKRLPGFDIVSNCTGISFWGDQPANQTAALSSAHSGLFARLWAEVNLACLHARERVANKGRLKRRKNCHLQKKFRKTKCKCRAADYYEGGWERPQMDWLTVKKFTGLTPQNLTGKKRLEADQMVSSLHGRHQFYISAH